LSKVKSGDEISVEFGDKSVRKFKVKSQQTVSIDEANRVLFQQDAAIKSELKLITCTEFNRQANSYNKRLIVSAEGI
jgi:LPXTG-site transpeptidase (sortase) family protein